MSVQLISWNVRGLHDRSGHRPSSLVIRQELQRALVGAQVDFLFLQEHKLSLSRCRRIGKILPGKSHTFWSEAEGTRGGVCIAVSAQWFPQVLDHGILWQGRAIWVIVGFGDSRIGFLNLYASVIRQDRIRLWGMLEVSLPEVDSWIIGGDFNNVENPEDKRGGSAEGGIHREEQASWERFLLRVGGSDAWFQPEFDRRVGSLQFSWSNRRHPESIFERLDRFYVGDWGLARGGSVGILAGSTFSDHSPVILTVQSSEQWTGEQRGVRIPDSLYSDPTLAAQLEVIWSSPREETRDRGEEISYRLQLSSALCRDQALLRRQAFQAGERALRRDLASLQRLLEQLPQDLDLHLRLRAAREQLRSLEEARAEFHFHSQRVSWARFGDRMRGEFFRAVGPGFSSDSVQRLRSTSGQLVSEPREVLEVATSFFRELYTGETFSELTREMRERVWEHTPCLVTEEMRCSLERPFSEEELLAALRELPAGKSPGEDGLSPSFFRVFWPFLGSQLADGFTELMQAGSLPQDFTSGLICLVPKGGDRTDVRQWRPITLLSTVYKLLAKAISLRLRPFLGELIRGSQTGFVQERSILDNVFTFWEATSWAQESGQELAVLLLDFEKAYDRVDWGFLEGSLSRFGFSREWIRGVAGLYTGAHSRLLVRGRLGDSFPISRSVRQGCPLAPFLFLFVAETMGHFLRARSSGLLGLELPLRGESHLLDAEFADDTALFLHGSVEVLEQTRRTLDSFCQASGARINWHKSVGFYTGSGTDLSPWGGEGGFRWIPRGMAVRYLGFQVGLDISPSLQFQPVLQSIRRKLQFWGQSRLSLAGRVLVANQVLLASIWYVASCWCLSSSCLGQVRRLIRNFVWSGLDGERDARARVAWRIMILPRREGGLGLIDPERQCRALLGRLVVRGFQPGGEPWKVLFRHRVSQVCPRLGGTWLPSPRWWFSEAPTQQPSSQFSRSLFRTWKALRGFLVRSQPTCREEMDRQQICWHPRIRDAEGRMLGERSHIPWAQWDGGVASSVGSWRSQTHGLREGEVPLVFSQLRGFASRREEIDRALPEEWGAQATGEDSPPTRWLGRFSRFGIPLCVIGALLDGTSRIFSVLSGGRLQLEDTDSALLEDPCASLPLQRVRIVGYTGRSWFVDPPPEIVTGEWRLWLWEGRPLREIQWDPGEWSWRSRDGTIPFFDYTTQLGRRIQMEEADRSHSRRRLWEQAGISAGFLSTFWARLWGSFRPPKVSHFFWLVVWGGLPVGSWLERFGFSRPCQRCSGDIQETAQHCLWSCSTSSNVWEKVARIFFRMGSQLTISWGAIAWLAQQGPPLWYEFSPGSRFLVVEGTGTRWEVALLTRTPGRCPQVTGQDTPWEIIASLTAWHLWRSRCSLLLGGSVVSEREVLSSIWSDLIHSLRGFWEGNLRDSRAARSLRTAFLRAWDKGLFFQENVKGLAWFYQPPEWLFS